MCSIRVQRAALPKGEFLRTAAILFRTITHYNRASEYAVYPRPQTPYRLPLPSCSGGSPAISPIILPITLLPTTNDTFDDPLKAPLREPLGVPPMGLSPDPSLNVSPYYR